MTQTSQVLAFHPLISWTMSCDRELERQGLDSNNKLILVHTGHSIKTTSQTLAP